MPVVIAPAIGALIYLEHKALKGPVQEFEGGATSKLKQGKLAVTPDEDALDVTEIHPLWHASTWTRIKSGMIEIDAIGLVL